MTYRVIFWDTETTGLDRCVERIVEIAAYDPQNDQEFSVIVNPGVSIPIGAERIHKISNEMVKDRPSLQEALPTFIDFCLGGEPGGSVIMIAHNGEGYDRPILENECCRHGIVLPVWNYLDSLLLARAHLPEIRENGCSYKLQDLRNYYEIGSDRAHRAGGDCRVLAQVFAKMFPNPDFSKLLPEPKLPLFSPHSGYVSNHPYRGTFSCK